MPRYTFTVRKGGCEISLITDDRDAVEQQIAIWVMALSRKRFNNIKPEPAPFIPEPLDEVNEAAREVSADASEHPLERENNLYDDAQESVCDKQEIFTPESCAEEVPESVSLLESAEQEGEAVESGITQNGVEHENMQAKVEEFVNTLDKTDVMAADLRNEHETAVTINTLFNAESPAKMDFESILEHSVDNISSDTVVKKDEIFCKLVKANNITDRLELLLFTADYFCKYDARFTFSLKQINGKLMHNLAVIVDHGILKIALDNNYLERAGEGEYRLTEYGRSEIYSKAGIWS